MITADLARRTTWAREAVLGADQVRRGQLAEKLWRTPAGPLVRALEARHVRRSAVTVDDYLFMQKRVYGELAAQEVVRPGEIVVDRVVGTWREHDAWPDYDDYLLRHVPPEPSWTALEFGCGPGRNLRRWSSRFARIDGVDILADNLAHAEIFLLDQLAAGRRPRLYETSGRDCGDAPTEHYDLVFSTICLQHICVHAVRYSILRDIFRVLKPGGRLSAQMGFGFPSPDSVPYYANFTQATGTNSDCDTQVENTDQLRYDLERLGFEGFQAWLRPAGPQDDHPLWVYFTATRPVPPDYRGPLPPAVPR